MEILNSLLVKDGSIKIFTGKYHDKDFIVCTTRLFSRNKMYLTAADYMSMTHRMALNAYYDCQMAP